MTRSLARFLALVALLAWTCIAMAQETYVFGEALYSGSIGTRSSRRSAVFTDPIMARYVAGNLTAPRAGEVSGKNSRGEALRWERIEADESGAFTGRSLRGGYLYSAYQQEQSYAFCGVVAKQTIRSRRQRRQEEAISERKIEITTENLRVFRIDLEHCQHLQKLTVEVDGQPLENLPWPQQNELWLKREGKRWSLLDEPPHRREKNPARYGGFKDAFRHRVLFVTSTAGCPEENEWSYRKARFDAETFYYRGNGSIDIIPDHAFTPEAFPDRSVILYGNASTNRAWKQLLDDCPVQIRRGEVTVGDRSLVGDDLGVYMVRPRPDSHTASVGVVSGTGQQGFRAVTPNRYFVAGTGYPDLMIISAAMYTQGVRGVIAAGYFGNDWSVEKGDIVWSKAGGEAAEQ